jgi:hypothetical protein
VTPSSSNAPKFVRITFQECVAVGREYTPEEIRVQRDEYKKSLDYLRNEIHRLAHLVIVHGSDPQTMLGRWADDSTCCPRSRAG